MSPRDVYPEGNAMWQRVGESRADGFILEVAGEGRGTGSQGGARSTSREPAPQRSRETRTRDNFLRPHQQGQHLNQESRGRWPEKGLGLAENEDLEQRVRALSVTTPISSREARGENSCIMGRSWDTPRALFLSKVLADQKEHSLIPSLETKTPDLSSHQRARARI